jgi:uracil phosphoribosyltransferase
MFNICSNNVLEKAVLDLRNPETDAPHFRDALTCVGYHLATRIAEYLPSEEKTIETVMGKTATHKTIAEPPYLIPILRAGIPMYIGFQKAFPYANVGFIGAMRNEETSEAGIGYVTTPDIEGKHVILIDPMIATGGSIVESIKLMERHNPEKIIVAGAICAKEGVKRIFAYSEEKNNNIDVYTAALDPILNSNNYIVPGLGDAGDRCFGPKKEKSL